MILCIFLLFVYVLYSLMCRKSTSSKTTMLRLPPVYPGAWPIIGHAHMIVGDNKHLYRFAESVSKESLNKGGVLLCYLGTAKYYIITDPDDFMTAGNQCLHKHFTYFFLKPWLGDGMISGQDNKIWKRHRKLLSPAFSQQVLDGFLEIFNSQSRKLVLEFANKVGKGPFDHSHYVDEEALENICKTAFGMTDGESVFDETFYMKSVQRMLGIITERFQKFWMHFDYIYSFSILKQNQDNVVKYLNETRDAVLQRKRENLESERSSLNINEKKYKAFMDLAMELSKDGILTDKEIWDEMNTIILAGYETTGNTLLFTLLLLGSHHEVQEKAYQEILNVFGKSDRDVEKDDLSKLVYLEAVIKETLRMYSITPAMLRHVEEDVNLRNYTMPAGSSCILFVSGLHRHSIWGPDVNEFRPERWLDANALGDPTSAIFRAFAGFGVGRRLCLGKTYSMMSLKTSLCHLLRRYVISSDLSKLELKMDPLLKATSGHEISLKSR